MISTNTFYSLVILVTALLLSACSNMSKHADELRQQVRIVRDDFGVPHVYAQDIYGLYYGYGYSIAQDRLFQIEMARRSTQGQVAEVLGSDYVEYDRNTRTLFSPGSIRQQLAALSQQDRSVFEGYAHGINTWLAEIRRSPSELTPKQFVDLAFMPSDWTAYDVAMIFIGTMNNRYGDFNTELENAAILDSLIKQHGESAGRSIFDLLNPRFTEDAPTTIPAADWTRPAYDSLAAFPPQDSMPLPQEMALKTSLISGFSNCYVIGKDKTGGTSSILVNGPQFGWFNPSYVYSVGLHGAGIDVVGNTPFGYPMIMFGHNRTISWGSTWGASDIVDIFAESLHPENSNQYLYKGHYIDFVRRTERIKVAGAQDVTFEAFRSVHGPIIRIDMATNTAYAKHRAWDGAELDTLLAWLRATWASDFQEWKQEAQKSAINVNMYFADVDGNIGYFHGGQFPERMPGHDNRFPVTGDGTMDWRGRQPVDSANPHVLNPASGFLANWNNKPGQGVMNPDFFFYSWSSADRVDILNDALRRKARFTPEEAWALLDSSSYLDVNASYFLPMIQSAALRSEDEMLLAANEILQAWNQSSRDSDSDGFYDEPATAIFRTFIGSLIQNVLSDDLGHVFPYFAASGYPTHDTPTPAGTNIPTGLKAIVEALNGGATFDLLNGDMPEMVVGAALMDAISQLTSDQQALDQVKLPVASRPFGTKNFLGIPQADDTETLIGPIEQNRGTENNMIVMERDAIVGWEVTPPGQSAFIDPTGTRNKHYDDQFDLYHSFGKKRMWFYSKDVEANKVSETRLTY